MSISHLKAGVWVLVLALGGYLSWFVADFVSRRDELKQAVTTEQQLALLNSVEPPPPTKEVGVEPDDVLTSFKNLNWTGKEAPKPAPPKPVVEGPKEEPVIPVDTLVSVLMFWVDTTKPEESLAYVKFLNPKMAAAAEKRLDGDRFKVGEHLPDPHAYVRIEEITYEGVVFAFDDEARPTELLTLPDDVSNGVYIHQVGEGGEIRVQETTPFPLTASNNTWKPERTELIGKNRYRVGTEDAKNFEQNYPQILAQDVDYKPHRDPQTGKRDGIQITRVRGGSLAASHGVVEGDVIKSINGHPVTSSQEAISYVKQEAPNTTTWVVVIENKGKEFTRTYESPQE